MSWLAAGLNFASNVFGRSGYSTRDAAADANAWNKQARDYAVATRHYQLNELVQRRVQDAKAAGIHPLYALGVSGGGAPSFSAGAGVAGERTGSVLGDGLGALASAASARWQARHQRAVARAQVRSLEAQAKRDEAEAELVASRTKRTEAAAMQGGPARAIALPTDGGRLSPPVALSPPREMRVAKRLGFVPSKTTPAEIMEEEYGDLGGSLYGLWRGLGDAVDVFRDYVRHRLPGPRMSFRGWRWKEPKAGSAKLRR